MYIPLHVHDTYSLLDGASTPAEYFARAKELGITHLAQTNHGTLMGHREWQREAKAAGIIPILGLEGYISQTDRFDKRSKAKREDGTNVYNHITMLAKDAEGLDTLNRLSAEAWHTGYYFKPRMDSELIFNDHKGIIVLSGCMSGLIAKAFERDDIDEAFRIAAEWKDQLGDDFYIEIMSSNDPKLNHRLLNVASRLGIRPVMTGDCHFSDPKDKDLAETMLILSTNPKRDFDADMSKAAKMDLLERYNYLYPNRTMTFEGLDLWMRTYEAERAAFNKQIIHRTDIYENTVRIAESIGEYPYHEGLSLLPKPKNLNPDELLRKRAFAGLRDRGLDKKPEYVERLEQDLKIVKDKDFSVYFIIVANAMRWAKNQGIRTGPGRGSACAFLLNYALGLTEIDPIEDGLLSFRFMDPNRDDPPDFDWDIQDNRRWEVKEYFRRQYKNVASIATITPFQGKSAVRGAARALGVPYSEINKAMKNNEAPDNVDFYEHFERSEKGAALLSKYPDIMGLARRLDGRIQSSGQHAAGIVLSSEPIHKYAPMETSKDPNDPTGPRITMAALDMGEVASIGMEKIDLLGLKTLSVIDDTIAYIKERTGRELDPVKDITRDCPEVYQMLSEGHTNGVFQCEKRPYTSLILKIGGVRDFDELVATNALIRPGAMNTIGDQYIARKHGVEMVEYIHADTRWFTEKTFGLATLFQEHMMLLMTEVAGFDMSTANKVRSIVAKKKDPKLLAKYRDEFIDGACNKIRKERAKKLWQDIEAASGYSFNLAHSKAYSTMSLWTAWLKYHYPVEFMSALLKNETDKDSITDYLIEAKRMGIRVLLPNVNKSAATVMPEGDGIRLGLTSVKYIAAKAAQNIINARPFESYADLLEKAEEKGSGINTRMLSALNAIGGATFPDNPKTGRERDNFYEYLQIPSFADTQLDPKVDFKFTDLDEHTSNGVCAYKAMVRKVHRGDGWARVELLSEDGTLAVFADEKIAVEAGNMYCILVANNRIHRYVTIDEMQNRIDNDFVRYMYDDLKPPKEDNEFITVSFQKYVTKAGKTMAYLVAMNNLGNLEYIIVFPMLYKEARIHARPGAKWKAEMRELEDGTANVKGFIK